jgi:hypothetical protein
VQTAVSIEQKIYFVQLDIMANSVKSIAEIVPLQHKPARIVLRQSEQKCSIKLRGFQKKPNSIHELIGEIPIMLEYWLT